MGAAVTEVSLGGRTFAASWTNGSDAQEAAFAKFRAEVRVSVPSGPEMTFVRSASPQRGVPGTGLW
jgi:hypothetical protein